MTEPRKGSAYPQPPRGFVRIRRNSASGQHVVSIPQALGRLIGTERLFKVELVDEGVLLRYVEGGEPLRSTLPSWLVE